MRAAKVVMDIRCIINLPIVQSAAFLPHETALSLLGTVNFEPETLQFFCFAMKEALVSSGPKVEVVDSRVPTAGPGDILIKVGASGSNPKDW